MKILLYKAKNGGIYPAYESDQENLKRVKYGEYFTAEVVKPRNIKLHRKFYALLNLVVANNEIYKSVEELKHDVLLEAGVVEIHYNFLGEAIKRPKSISFSSMDDYEFAELYEKCVNVIVQHFCFDKESLEQEILQFF